MEELLNIVAISGQAILEIYNSDFDYQIKIDGSPVTLADKRSFEMISKKLGAIYPDIPILSEEGDLPYLMREKRDYLWLIDPLDGTKEFIQRNGQFTINVALIYGSKPIAGVIYAPLRDTFYFAMEGMGAYKLEGAQVLKDAKDIYDVIKASKKLPHRTGKRPFTIIASRSHLSKDTEEYIEKIKGRYHDAAIFNIGSSLKLCMIAEGSADIYPRLGPTMEWDIAAGHLILKEAYGEVLSFDTHTPLQYNKRDPVNPRFIAVSRYCLEKEF